VLPAGLHQLLARGPEDPLLLLPLTWQLTWQLQLELFCWSEVSWGCCVVGRESRHLLLLHGVSLSLLLPLLSQRENQQQQQQ
jgi:hypothetical protein